MTNRNPAIRSIFAFISAIFVIQLAPQALANSYETLAAYEKKITHVNISKDGSYEEVEEYTILIKSQQAVDAWSQAEISFSSDHQTLEVLEAYTILPDGQKIKVADNAIRTVDDEVSSGAAMFSDLKSKIIIFPNVKVGAKIFYKELRKWISKITSQRISWSKSIGPACSTRWKCGHRFWIVEFLTLRLGKYLLDLKLRRAKRKYYSKIRWNYS